MTDELKDYDEELEKIIGDVRKAIDGLPKLKPADRQNKISLCHNRINRAKQVFKAYKLEMRGLDKTVAEPFAQKAKVYGDNINKLIQDLTWAEEKGELLGSGADKGETNLDNMTTDAILDRADATQVKSHNALDRTLQQIEETKGVGADTAAKLKAQTEQLSRTEDQMKEIDSNLQRASKELRAFVRRTATDKLVLGFMCLIVCGIIFIIVWSIVDPNNGTTSVPDAVIPKN